MSERFSECWQVDPLQLRSPLAETSSYAAVLTTGWF